MVLEGAHARYASNGWMHSKKGWDIIIARSGLSSALGDLLSALKLALLDAGSLKTTKRTKTAKKREHLTISALISGRDSRGKKKKKIIKKNTYPVESRVASLGSTGKVGAVRSACKLGKGGDGCLAVKGQWRRYDRLGWLVQALGSLFSIF
jgi:hypothetical protein